MFPGHVDDDPEHVSATSHIPVLGLHVVELGSKVFVQVVLDPEQ